MKTNAYSLKNIKVRHAGSLALDIAELNIPRQQSTAILGENGAGKTTLLNLLACINAPTQGQISLFDETVQHPLPAPLRRKIGLVSQQPYLLAGSVAENIRLALQLQHVDNRLRETALQKALQQTNLLHLANQPANTLSGGELKRAAIARVLAYEPDILLLDEPFSHLDQRHIRQLEDTIAAFAALPDKTVIFSTHDRIQARALSDNAINLVAGKPTTAPLLNLFHGHYQPPFFHTANLLIHATGTTDQARHIAIDPTEIIISEQALDHASVRNSYSGQLIQITQEGDRIRLTIDCGERFHAIISPDSLAQLQLSLGQAIWVSFKSTAVTLL